MLDSKALTEINNDWVPDDLKKAVQEISEIRQEIFHCTARIGGRMHTDFQLEYGTIGDFPTPTSRLSQIIAQVEKLEQAFHDNYYKCQKAQNKLLRLDIPEFKKQKIRSEIQKFKYLYQGAITQYHFWVKLYKKQLSEMGVDHVDRELINKHQPEDHFKIAMLHVLRNGFSRNFMSLDEGTQMYLDMVRIGYTEALHAAREFILDARGVPQVRTWEDRQNWIDKMWEQFRHKVPGFSSSTK